MQKLTKLRRLIYVLAVISMNIGISNASEGKPILDDEIFAHCRKYNLSRADWENGSLPVFANDMRVALQKGDYGDTYGAPPLFFLSAYYFYNILPVRVDVRLLRDLFIQTPADRRTGLFTELNATVSCESYQTLCERPGLKKWLLQLPYQSELRQNADGDLPLYCFLATDFNNEQTLLSVVNSLSSLFIQTPEDRRKDLLPSLRETLEGSALVWLCKCLKLKAGLFQLPYQPKLVVLDPMLNIKY